MRYLLVRNETNIKDITDKAFKGLSGTPRKQAEAALLKANPELKTFKTVRKGFMVRVPKMSASGKPDRRSVVDPIEGIADQTADHLKRFEARWEEMFLNVEKTNKQVIQHLKAANASIKNHPAGATTVKALKKHMTETQKNNDKKVKLGKEALEMLQKTLINFDR